MLEINADSYNVVVWVTSHFFGPLYGWWFNRRHHATISDSFDSVVAKICKTSMVPNIMDDAIKGVLDY
jgi:hypothetical protein